MMDQGRQEHGNGKHFGGKNGFGDQVRVLDHGAGGAGYCFLKEHPREESAEQEHQVTVGSGGRLDLHAYYEDVIPDQELHYGMDNAPEPSGDGAYVALLEIAAD